MTAVDQVSFDIDAGETVAIVGESGSGKSVTALSIMRLIPTPPGRIETGEVIFEGQDLLKLDDAGIRAIRGNKIAMIFQEPMSSLNPALTVGMQVAEPVNLHRGAAVGQGAGAGQGAAGPRAHPRCGEPARLLPAPVFRRHAPARHDRHGARLPAAPDHRRRADHGARRHRAGADPRSAEGADARDRLVAAAHHARSRAWSPATPTASPSCTAGASSRPRRRASSTSVRAIPTRWA